MSDPKAASNGLIIKTCRVRQNELFELPARVFPEDAGLDLLVSRPVIITPGAKAQIPTNTAIELPPGFFGLVLPRSSTFYTRQLIVHPGTIDNGYRGELLILAQNYGARRVTVNEGDRLAQLIVMPMVAFSVKEVDKLSKSARGDSGIGSSGGHRELTEG